MLNYPVSCGGVYGLGCNLKIVTIPPTEKQGHHTHTHTHVYCKELYANYMPSHTHTHIHTHTYYCKEL